MTGGSRAYGIIKDIIDRLLAGAALLLLSPLLLAVVVAIVLDSSGNPIFCQERVGKDGRRFTLYKFRTMLSDNNDQEYRAYIRSLVTEGKPFATDGQGLVYKLRNDKRITRLGAILRRTDVDELPQFVNVLKGDISLVGPRPDIPFSVGLYKEWHLERLSVKPGLTGPWQINGRDRVPFDEMVRIDLDYIQRRSLALDMKVLLLTAPSIAKRALHRKGI